MPLSRLYPSNNRLDKDSIISLGKCHCKISFQKNIRCWVTIDAPLIFTAIIMEEHYSYEEIDDIAKYLRSQIKDAPKIGIICGSGLGSIGDILADPIILDYKDIPKFPVSTAEGHAGKLIFGKIANTSVVCMQGRFHFYEGYPLWKCVLPVHIMKFLGVTHIIASNAAGGLNESYKLGDIMLIQDHINFVGFAGNNPLRGANEPRFGPRFVALNNAYDKDIIKHAKEVGKELGLEDSIKVGIYACLGGPNYETVAELKALRALGVDAVGMSTVHEIITAKHCQIKCFAFSLVTNKCVTHYETDEAPYSEEVLEIARQRENDVKRLVERMVAHMSQL